LWIVHRKNKFIAIAIFIIFISTNIFTFDLSSEGFRLLFPEYLHEIHNDYPSPYKAIEAFFQRNGNPDDSIYAIPEYANYPIMFYLGDKFRICCVLNKDTKLPIEKIKTFNAPLFVEDNFPKWLIALGASHDTREMLNFFSRPHIEGNKVTTYIYKLEKILDVYAHETYRPELPWHSFRPIRHFNRSTDAVYIFRRMEE
jgi:hypothetical protein